MTTLIICEKRDAAQRISYLLSEGKVERGGGGPVATYRFTRKGEEHICIGLRGHIVNLDYSSEKNDWRRYPLEELIDAEPTPMRTEKAIISTLEGYSRKADSFIVATDYDREGELIGLEALEVARIEPRSCKRARFSSLTGLEVNEAFRNLGVIDVPLAESGKSRQHVDLAWGAVLTRFITIAAGRGGGEYMSVGRVQTPTLALLVERHRIRESFVPEPFWDVLATLAKRDKPDPFKTSHIDNSFKDEKKATAVVDRVAKAVEATVSSYNVSDKTDRPPTPFDTTRFIREASKLGFGAKRAMELAEQLYMAGKISYPRTDNTVYPRGTPLREILKALKKTPLAELAEKVDAQPDLKPSRGSRETTDHPPIHPVDAAGKEELGKEKWAIYELVARRFLATLAPPSKYREGKASFDIAGEKFVATGIKITEMGWREYYPYIEKKENHLPVLAEGERLTVLHEKGQEPQAKQGFTQPPHAYNQGTLIVEMEKLGLGTKSTRHETIQKLLDRNYVQGKNLEPTPSGIALVTALERHAPIITQSQMTAELETEMESIADGNKTYQEVIQDSRKRLHEVLEVLKREQTGIISDLRSALDSQHNIGKCPVCGNNLQIRRSRMGGQFIGCSGFPDCRVTFPLPAGAKVEPTEKTCTICSKPMMKVSGGRGKHGEICVDPDCETNRQLDFIGKCPVCGKDLSVRIGRTGKRFVGCTGYPECTKTFPLPQMGKVEAMGEVCPNCGLPMIRVLSKGKRPWEMCLDMNCGRRGQAQGEGKAAEKAAPAQGTGETLSGSTGTVKPAAKARARKKKK